MLKPRSTLLALGVVSTLTVACNDTPVAPAAAPTLDVAAVPTAGPGNSHNAYYTNDIRSWIRDLRKHTRVYRSYDEAAPGGYVAQLSECVELPDGSAGMGYHIGNPALIDTELDPMNPEILLYEPQEDGSWRFVAVEFIVPIAAWQSAEPPQVQGVELHQNTNLGLWVLHVWTERRNPDGVFEDFNPRVSCDADPVPAN